jgi:hypothetical protein
MIGGLSFDPDSMQNRARQSFLNPQQSEALKVLSMRLPSTLSGRPIAEESLLRPSLSRGPASAVGDTLSRATGISSLPLSSQPGPGSSVSPSASQSGSLFAPAPPSMPASIGTPPSAQPLAVNTFSGSSPTASPSTSPFTQSGPDTSALGTLVGGALNPTTGSAPPPNVQFSTAPAMGNTPMPAPAPSGPSGDDVAALMNALSGLFGWNDVAGGRGGFGGGRV